MPQSLSGKGLPGLAGRSFYEVKNGQKHVGGSKIAATSVAFECVEFAAQLFLLVEGPKHKPMLDP